MDKKLKIPLKELIPSLCEGNYTHQHLQQLYQLLYTIARRLIRHKTIAYRISFDTLGLTEADITHDCIAELFVLGKGNELCEIKKYFNYQHIIIEDLPEEDLLMNIRKLVFTVVGDNLFRILNEADPSLGKIIRNLKIALGKQSNFCLTTHFGEYYLELKNCDTLNGCVTISDEDLNYELTQIMKNSYDIPDILSKVAELLTFQENYKRHVRMLSLACAIKNGYHGRNIPDDRCYNEVEASFISEDTDKIIKNVCNNLMQEMMPKYLKKGKVDEKMFQSYIDVIVNILCNEFIEGKNGDITYFDQFKEYHPDITKEEYMRNHRVIIEYLGKIAKNRVTEGLKGIL